MPPRYLSRINAQSQVLQDVFGKPGHVNATPSVLMISPPTTSHGPRPVQWLSETSPVQAPPGSSCSLEAAPKRHRSRSQQKHRISLSTSSHASFRTAQTTISTPSPVLPGQDAFPSAPRAPSRNRSTSSRNQSTSSRNRSPSSRPLPLPRQDSVTSLTPSAPAQSTKTPSLVVPARGHHRSSSAPLSPLPGQTFPILEPTTSVRRGRSRAATRTSPPPSSSGPTRYSSRPRHRAASHAESLVAKLDLPVDSLILVTSAHTVLGQNIVGTLLNAGFRVRGVVPDAERAVRGFRLHREIFGPSKYTASVVGQIKAVGALRLAVRSCRGVVVIDEKLPDMDYVMNVLEAARREPDRSVERFVYCGAEGPAVLSVARQTDGVQAPYGGEVEESVKWSVERRVPPMPQMPQIPGLKI